MPAPALTYDVLKAAVAGSAAAFRLTLKLEPVSPKVFPPTYTIGSLGGQYATEERIIPGYGLEGMEYVTSSTAAMLTELKAATEAGENIAVTLWAPHWAYDTFDLKNLEDPEGTLGASETIHAYGKKDFSTDFPQATEWIADYTMDLDKLQSLEAAMFVDYDGQDYGPIVAKWIEDNQEYVDSLTA